MKKLMVFLLLMAFYLLSNSQSILRGDLGNKNIGLSIGRQIGNYGILAGYIISYRMPETPLILHLSFEKRLMIDNIDEDLHKAIYIIPSIGVGRCSWSDFKNYTEAHNYDIVKRVKYLPIYGLSIGKTANIGMLTASLKYCKEMFISIGLSAYIGRF